MSDRIHELFLALGDLYYADVPTAQRAVHLQDELNQEVVTLRAELAREREARQAAEKMHDELLDIADVLAAERAAHEATKRELEERKGREAALKRDWIALVDERDAASARAEAAEKAERKTLDLYDAIECEFSTARRWASAWKRAAEFHRAHTRLRDKMVSNWERLHGDLKAERDRLAAEVARLKEALERIVAAIDPDALHKATPDHCARFATDIARAALRASDVGQANVGKLGSPADVPAPEGENAPGGKEEAPPMCGKPVWDTMECVLKPGHSGPCNIWDHSTRPAAPGGKEGES